MFAASSAAKDFTPCFATQPADPGHGDDSQVFHNQVRTSRASSSLLARGTRPPQLLLQSAGQSRVRDRFELLAPHQPDAALVHSVGQEVLVEELLGPLDRDSKELGRLADGDPVRLRVMGVTSPGVVLEGEGFDLREGEWSGTRE